MQSVNKQFILQQLSYKLFNLIATNWIYNDNITTNIFLYLRATQLVRNGVDPDDDDIQFGG